MTEKLVRDRRVSSYSSYWLRAVPLHWPTPIFHTFSVFSHIRGKQGLWLRTYLHQSVLVVLATTRMFRHSTGPKSQVAASWISIIRRAWTQSASSNCIIFRARLTHWYQSAGLPSYEGHGCQWFVIKSSFCLGVSVKLDLPRVVSLTIADPL